MLEEEESESAEPDDPSTTGASQTHTHGNTGGREHNTSRSAFVQVVGLLNTSLPLTVINNWCS